jgi:predicted Zn-dependent protease
MAARIMGSRDIGYTLEFHMLDHDMVNAFAAPGGQIVFLRGLLDKASGPDEVAAILGHEIGHVAARDPTQLTLSAVGSAGILSVDLGDVSGGTLLAMAGDQLMQASYTRDAEAAADAFAFALLNDANISTEGMATFFTRIAGLTDNVPEILSSHPLSGNRAAAARANAAFNTDTTPALTAADWHALHGL